MALLFTTLLAAKSHWAEGDLLITYQLEAGDHLWLLSNSLLVFGLLWLVFRRHLIWGLIVFQVLTTVVFWGDLLYCRYFEDALSFYLLSVGWQVSKVLDSAARLVQPRDYMLLLDLPLWLLLLYRFRPPPEDLGERERLKPDYYFLGALLLCGTVGNIAYFQGQDSNRSNIFFKRFRNLAIVERAGLLNYHLYDGFQALRRSLLGDTEWEGDRETLRRLVKEAQETVSRESPYAGLLKGKNVLMIQLESLQAFAPELVVADQEVMPFTRRWLEGCLVFHLFDQSHHGRSSDGEFCMLNGFHPPSQTPLCFSYADNQFGGLVRTLAENGYETVYALPYSGTFWNARHMSGKYGFQKRWFKKELGPVLYEEQLGWGMKDQVLFERVLDRLDTLKKPFFVYTVTLGCHHPYSELDKEKKELVLRNQGLQKMTQGYLHCCRYRDHALRYLVQELEHRGLTQDTVLILVGDHDARLPEEDFEKLGLQQKILEDKVPAIFFAPEVKWPETRPPVLAGQIDLSPTLLHLLGLPATYPTLGWSVLSRSREMVVSRAGYGITQEGGWLEYTDWETVKTHGPGEPGQRAEQMREQLDASQGLLQLDLLRSREF